MKRAICILLILTLLIPNIAFAGDDNLSITDTVKNILNRVIEKLSDISNHWAKELIALLYDKGIIGGYPDGTFRPNNSITRAEFTKIFVTSLHEDVGNSSEGHWATNYLNKAIEEGYVLEGEFDDLNKNITRGEMARMIVRALDEDYPENINDYKEQIKDYNDIPKEYKDFVLKAYVKGIITGYPDGTFKYNQTATRAEASTMIVRLLEPEKREVPELNKEGDNKVSEDFIEPEFQVYYYKSIDAYEYFGIQLTNWEDYEGHEEYYFTTECISHPEINYIDWYSKIDGRLLKSNENQIEYHKSNYDRFYGNGQIYGLWKFAVWKPAGCDEHFAPEEGEILKYKITVTNGEDTKEYYVDVKFKYKDFRY